VTSGNIINPPSNIILLKITKEKSSYLCSQCPSDQFNIIQNEACEKCVDGGRCINGTLLNTAGLFYIK